jgi:hypothetical protein
MTPTFDVGASADIERPERYHFNTCGNMIKYTYIIKINIKKYETTTICFAL